ncbi:hypothetical protein R5M92_11300 [Halomonas sp. Bachu 37]|uniref:hypothetical protein n=1 Tax=Halomonas kashgarensis TaxID=3084920 RepID=UPI00321764D1
MQGNEQQPGDTVSDHNDGALKKLKGSVREYINPFEPVGVEEWEAASLDELTPAAAHADDAATPTLTEPG